LKISECANHLLVKKNIALLKIKRRKSEQNEIPVDHYLHRDTNQDYKELNFCF